MTPDQMLGAIGQLSKLADQLEYILRQLMHALPQDAIRGQHLYEAAHSMGAIPGSIRRVRGHLIYALREMEHGDDLP